MAAQPVPPGIRVVQALDLGLFLAGAYLLLSGTNVALGLAVLVLSVLVTLGVQVHLQREQGR